jgi:HK97 gp10 family phage protein
VSINPTFNVAGLRELEAALIELGSEVAGKNGGLVRTALWTASKPVLDSAIGLAEKSRDTGDLKGAIVRTRVREPDPEIKANEVIEVGLIGRGKGKKVFHGGFIEFGTSRTAAQPFLRPALESNADGSAKIFRTKLAGGIQRVAKKIGNKNAAAVGARVKKL